MEHYSAYCKGILDGLKEKNVQHADFRSHLMTMRAFDHEAQHIALLSTDKAVLKSFTTLNEIHDFITDKYASFLNYEILQSIVKSYSLDNGKEEFKYPEHLESYLKYQNLSWLIQDIELHARKKVVLKIDYESTCSMTKIIDLHTTIAIILGLNSTAALQLYDLKDGCVEATFLIPTHIAEVIFNKLTDEQRRKFRALSVLSLQYNGHDECKFCNNEEWESKVKGHSSFTQLPRQTK